MSVEVEEWTLADCLPDDRNANKGNERGAIQLENSLREYGAGRSILLDKHGKVIAGNKTVEQCGQIGLEDVLVIKTDGTKLVAVQRTDIDLDSEQGRLLAIADNRAGEVGLTWDPIVLEEFVSEGLDLSTFWKPDEFEALIKEATASPEVDKIAPEVQPSEKFMVLIECKNSSEQAALLDRFLSEGLECKALNA